MRYLGIEVDDALSISEQVELLSSTICGPAESRVTAPIRDDRARRDLPLKEISLAVSGRAELGGCRPLRSDGNNGDNAIAMMREEQQLRVPM